MFLILTIDAIVIITLISVARRGGVEKALPYFVFVATLLPEECRIRLPGLFDLYTHRLALIVLIVLFFSGKRRSVVRTLPLKRLILVHVAWVFISTLASIVVVTSLKQLLAQVLEYYVVFYIFTKSITSVRTIIALVYAMIAAMSVACVFGMFEIYAKWSVLSIFPADLQQTYGTGDPLYVEMMDRGVRVHSTFAHPILFGGAISMMVPMALYVMAKSQKGVQRAFVALSLVLMLWNLYKTSSRGPWVATIVSTLLLLLASEPKIRKRIAVVASLAILSLIVRPGVAATIWNTYLATLNPDTQMGASFEYRPALFHAVTKALNQTPSRALFGFGLGSFREKGLIIVLPKIETHRWYTCDSSWVLFMYETGYVGFIILGALLFRPAFMALRGYWTLSRRDRDLSLTFCCSFVSFFMVMISVAAYGWGQNGYMLWLLVAMTVSYIALKKNERRLVTLKRNAEAIAVEPEAEVQTQQSRWLSAVAEQSTGATAMKLF
jgi:hypothetical protein